MGIPIIDLFAGPGGLGEGFMSVKKEDGTSFFDIKLSIEKEENAHKTLTLRSFLRQFSKNGRPFPSEYYEIIREQDVTRREGMIEDLLDRYPEGAEARVEARKIELGSDQWPPERLDTLIRERLEGESNNWVLIGGPPCQAYSNAGRGRVGGINPEDHRVYLYREYLRIIQEHRPSVFVMENVKGLLSAEVNGEKVFEWMKRDLSCEGHYEIKSFVRDVKTDRDYTIISEDYGIPQTRHRVILLGLRKDVKGSYDYLQVKEQVSLKSVIGKLPKVRSVLNRSFIGYSNKDYYKNGKPKRLYKTLSDSDDKWQSVMHSCIKQLKIQNSEKWSEIGKDELTFKISKGSEFVIAKNTMALKHPLNSWYTDKRLKGVLNHESRTHLQQDLNRYLFASLYTGKHKAPPKLEDFSAYSRTLLPDHQSAETGKFADRFKVQRPDKPATTITSHISKDGHYFIHYDPSQCRSLTVREAARIQTFPDNYLFRGSRTSQYQQVGNAVPPYLAFQLAEIVKTILE